MKDFVRRFIVLGPEGAIKNPNRQVVKAEAPPISHSSLMDFDVVVAEKYGKKNNKKEPGPTFNEEYLMDSRELAEEVATKKAEERPGAVFHVLASVSCYAADVSPPAPKAVVDA